MLKWIWSHRKAVQIPERQYTEKAGSLFTEKAASIFWDKNIFGDLNYCVYRDNTRNSEENKQDLFAEGDIFFFQESSENSFFWIT